MILAVADVVTMSAAFFSSRLPEQKKLDQQILFLKLLYA
jgi:hypothetical protein